MKTLRVLGCLLIATSLSAKPVARPKILGLANVSYFVSDLAKSRAFYEDFLGYQEAFTLPNSSGGVRVAFVKINDHQFLELDNEKDHGEGQLEHTAVYTDNAEQMRRYLASQGVQVPPKVMKDETGNKSFEVKDPDGHLLEFVQYMPNSLTARDTGKHLPDTRICDRILHTGFIVGDLDKSTKFYNGILGFTEFWRGSGNGKNVSWIDMKVPDGVDYVEFMLYGPYPAPDHRGVNNHVALAVEQGQMPKTAGTLKERAAAGLYTKTIVPKIGADNKWQCNLYDPDGTRLELMDPNPVAPGLPPPTTLPPPVHD
jgi:catechol 2,3-dioxygenase-like lactoylglutathione lyase family enzyme